MSQEYTQYIIEHKANVEKAYRWLFDHNILDIHTARPTQIINHDLSKYQPEEYDAYDNYFYGSRSYENVEKFNYAWLHHIHNNPHHWQHWILINDDPEEGQKILDMPDCYIVEMNCDWWSFSLKQNKPEEIFNWYDAHKRYILLSEYTRSKVEYILKLLKRKLEEPIEIRGSIEGTVDEIIEE